MKLVRGWCWGWALWLAGCVACSSSGEKTSCFTGAAPEQEAYLVEHYCRPMGQMICSYAAQCGCGHFVEQEGECAQRWENECRQNLSRFHADWDAGRLRVCPQAVAACVDAYRPLFASCLGRAASLPAACVQMLSVGAPLGKPCAEAGWGCADGAGICRLSDGVCLRPPDVGQPCEGVCAGESVCSGTGVCFPGEAGAACADAGDCRLGLFCVSGVCADALAPGEPCEQDTECFPGLACDGECRSTGPQCRSEAECGQQAVCLPQGLPVCRLRAGEGQACVSHGECAPELYCDGGFCRLLPGEGMPCADGVLCAAGLSCRVDAGLCAELPVEGEPCGMDASGPFVCAPGLACLSGVCGQLPAEGEACGSGNHACAPGLGCEFRNDGTNICVPKGAAGDACTNDTQCVDGTFCDYRSMLCEEVYANGAACRYGNECGADALCMSAGGDPVCTPVPGVGEPCSGACREEAYCAPPDGVCAAPLCAETARLAM